MIQAQTKDQAAVSFTPGPWQVVKHKKGWHIACSTHAIAETFGQNEANGRLIAAAPELLEALKIARECIAYCRRAHKDAQSGEGMPVEIILDAAIAKAGG